MEEKKEFAQWLRNEKKYSDRTISDTFSRINRALNILPEELNAIDRHYITNLEDEAEFNALAVDRRSQIRRAIRQWIAFRDNRAVEQHYE